MLTRKTTAGVLLVVLAVVAAPPSALAWTWPADGPVLRGFDFGGPEYREHGHTGIDVGGDHGAAVRAPAAGRVSFAGWLPTNGRTVTIRSPDGYAVTLLHLGSVVVSADDGVAEGEPVGTIGPSGDPESEVPYVHLGIRRADDPKGYVDPLTLLPERPAPVVAAPPSPPAAPAAPPAPHEPVSAPPAASEAPASGAVAAAPAADRRPVPSAPTGVPATSLRRPKVGASEAASPAPSPAVARPRAAQGASGSSEGRHGRACRPVPACRAARAVARRGCS